MGIKLFIGQGISSAVDNLVSINFKLAGFIPNGRLPQLDLKRAGLQPNIIFDVGANIGQTANNYHKHFPDATIYSFEPVKETYLQLLKNTRHFKVKCFNLALGDQEGYTTVYKSETYSGINSIKGSNIDFLPVTEKIKVSTGSAFCQENNIDFIDLLKIDTEGYDLNVLRGFGNMIKTRVKFIYLEAGFEKNDPLKAYITDVIQYVVDHNFVLSGFYSPLWFDTKKLKLNHCDILFANKTFLEKSE